MKNEKNAYGISSEVLEINELNRIQAEFLIRKLRQEDDKSTFIEVDCVPNGQLNAFHYRNGHQTAQIMIDLAGDTLEKEKSWLEEMIMESKNSGFETNLSVAEKAGLWKRVSINNYSELLNWREPFCIKNEKGLTRIWHPDHRILNNGQEFSTRGGITTFIAENTCCLQKYYLPLAALKQGPQWRMIYRLVFFAEEGKTNFDFVGGIYICRPRFKIYLDKSSVIGLISPFTLTDGLI